MRVYIAGTTAEYPSTESSVRCGGTHTLCWLPRGHSRLGIALAQSCNAYFLALAAELNRDRALSVFHSLGLAGPGGNFDVPTAIGLGRIA